MRLLTWPVLAAAGLFAGCVSAQEPATQLPPPMVRWAPPASAVIDARYMCGDDPVELTLEHDRDGVRVVRYVGGAGPASPRDLAKWNEWLQPVGRFFHHQFSCTGGGNESIVVRGASTRHGSDRVVVPVQWGRGELFLNPVGPGISWD